MSIGVMHFRYKQGGFRVEPHGRVLRISSRYGKPNKFMTIIDLKSFHLCNHGVSLCLKTCRDFFNQHLHYESETTRSKTTVFKTSHLAYQERVISFICHPRLLLSKQ